MIDIASHTITGADDWPMFLTMIKLVAWVVAGAWGVIIGLIGVMWFDLKHRISTQRAEDNSTCRDCKNAIWEHIDGPLWSAIKDCCSFLSQGDRKKLHERIKKQTGESCA